MSACPPILLQKSFCVTEYKFSGPYARRSNNHLRDLHYPAMNSRATSVMARRLHRSAIAACLVSFREIDPTAFWEFCITIWRHVASDRRMDGKSAHGSMRLGTGSPLSDPRSGRGLW